MNEINKCVGNVKNVTINRNKLLSIIKDNKAKHDAIFEAAVSGYWIEVKDVINAKSGEFTKYMTELNTDFHKASHMLLDKIEKQETVSNYSTIPVQNIYFNYGVNLKYPESHGEEYNRAICAVTLNIYDNIELTEVEFNQYVMNDWSWKASFVSSNNTYVNKYITGCFHTSNSSGGYMPNVLISGCNIL